MKKLITVFLLISSVLFAEEHMTFKGLPIDGPKMEFVKNLKATGFTVIDSTNGTYLLEGMFAAEKCIVSPLTTKSSNTTWKVVCFFPTRASWGTLKNEYLKLKKAYTNKYGEGQSYEFFMEPYYEGDGYEFQAISKEKCIYYTSFNTDLGTISIEIMEGFVAVKYEDAINVKIYSKEKNTSIYDDI